MKVTALIPDELMNDVKNLAHGKNITDSLVIALKEWSSIQRMKILRNKVKSHPLKFRENFTAQSIRSLNRER